ncbi:basic leucine zipper 43-like [Curcuma longa]|uniref:basic leucine zipper 43-like n=1 Tax=Curcuma longa TaxID=136217 RepID=UPI003D9F9E84
MQLSPSNPPPPLRLQNYSQLLQNWIGVCSPNSVGATEILHDRRQQSTAEQRKQRRMISNRESARRARVRRQQQLCELRAQVAHLRSANCRLLGELNRVVREKEELRHENAWMEEEETELRSKFAH